MRSVISKTTTTVKLDSFFTRGKLLEKISYTVLINHKKNQEKININHKKSGKNQENHKKIKKPRTPSFE